MLWFSWIFGMVDMICWMGEVGLIVLVCSVVCIW